MRLLHVLEATQGGTRRHVLDLLPALQARGFEVELVFSGRRHPPFLRDAEALRARGIPCHEIPMTRGPHWSDGAALRALMTHFRARKPDLLHLHSTKAGLLGRLAAVFAPNVPVVYTPHCIAFATGLPPLQKRAARLLEGVLSQKTDHFIAVSGHEGRILRRTVARNKPVSVVCNGVDLEAFDALQLPTPKNSENLVVGCFGRISTQKNQEFLLRIWPRILETMPSARLRLVGSGPEQPKLRLLASRLGIENSIEWMGEILEARPQYASCDVVAQPSRWEGLPYSILEAMAARRAVVAAPAGGVPELLADGAGVLAPKIDVFGRCLLALLQKGDSREEMGQCARLKVESVFSLEQMTARTAAIYRDCPVS